MTVVQFDPDIHVELLLSDVNGVYIPQMWANDYGPGWSGVGGSTIEALRAGPHGYDNKGNEYYWDSWNHALNNAEYHDDAGRTWTIYQSGDLFMIESLDYGDSMDDWYEF